MRTKHVSCFVALMTVSLYLTGRSASAQQPRAVGITFEIDTTTFTENAIPAGSDAVRLWQAFGSFSARVSFAAGRGRLELTGRRVTHTVAADGLALTVPLASVGDYYLFDSTGFILVRPQSKAYSVLGISADSYNSIGSREGWPRMFRFVTPRFDTVDVRRFVDSQPSGPIRVYWHADRVPYTSPKTAEVARGSIMVESAPYGEFNVIQWFGASRALAHLVERGGSLPTRATLTAAMPWQDERGVEAVPPTMIFKRELIHLRSDRVSLLALTLPNGYSETPWPGQQLSARNQALRASVARWHNPPEERKD
jgi:hypothetical protein